MMGKSGRVSVAEDWSVQSQPSVLEKQQKSQGGKTGVVDCFGEGSQRQVVKALKER